MRPTDTVLPNISKEWVKGFRSRRGLTRLRRPTTDRPTSTVEDINADNAWRLSFEDVCKCAFIANALVFHIK